ncbi:DUF5615 family PIN-like protein [Lyngbya sp. CCY1209]|jgi:hypothetical protein|uniref:DUF433 domain-containing protein n=1 Tax=Lyngbya sp. CCY1209 TaxID=2886103 RepID=UPI002D20ECE0|nr:DUF5615 family PIN-like protein [Lyngbya sp. CCY1209]MEB3884918.1 DUF433 domain-containing protein [Lyngbya sp. CCY1209]
MNQSLLQGITIDVNICHGKPCIRGLRDPVEFIKDADFVDSFLLRKEPHKLLLISTGNITNTELETLFSNNLSRWVQLLSRHDFVEMSRDAIVVHQSF